MLPGSGRATLNSNEEIAIYVLKRITKELYAPKNQDENGYGGMLRETGSPYIKVGTHLHLHFLSNSF